jgi:hypothetical protein
MLARCREAAGFAAVCLSIAADAWGEDPYAIERIERFRDNSQKAVLIFARFQWNDSEQRFVASVREQDCGLDLATRYGAIGVERSHVASGTEWQWGGMQPGDRLFTEVCRAGTRAPCSAKGCQIPQRGPRDL